MENENQELNQQDAQNQENNSESSKTYTAEEYEELRGKYNASTKEAQKLSWIAKVAVDNTKFIKLYNSDKRQAEEVAKHFGKSAKELYDLVKAEY
jgi:superfamily II DNA or RNA helicase